jgi:hypothetical protein
VPCKAEQQAARALPHVQPTHQLLNQHTACTQPNRAAAVTPADNFALFSTLSSCHHHPACIRLNS